MLETRNDNRLGDTAPVPPVPAAGSRDALRSLAVQHLERVRKLRLDLAAFLLGTVVIGAIWAITEYGNSGGWPHRISDQGNPGDFRRPVTEAEIEREIRRLTGR
jgi:hypothetical protein